jgi:hypothetical protein
MHGTIANIEGHKRPGRLRMPAEVRAELVDFSERLWKLTLNHPEFGLEGRRSGALRRIVKALDERYPDGRIKNGKVTKHVASMASVSKWYKGQSLPEDKNLDRLAELLDTPIDYLTHGELTAEHFRPEKISLAARAKAATHIFGNYVRLSGGDFGFPKETDARHKTVDLTVSMNDESVDVRLVTGDVCGPKNFQVALPSNWGNSEIVVALHVGRFKIDFVHLPARFLSRITGRRGKAAKIFHLTAAGDEYEATNGDRLPIMHDFEALFYED